LRVLLVAHRYPPDSHAGVEIYTQRLAGELTRAGDNVSIVTRRWAETPATPRLVREQTADGATLYKFDGGMVEIERFLDHHARLEQLFTAAIVECAPDVVHFNHLLGLSPRFIEIAHRLRVAVVVSLHDFYFACPLGHLQRNTGELCDGPNGGRACANTCFASQPDNPMLRWGLRALYYRQTLRLAHRLVAGSQYVASYFDRHVPELAPVRVIPNGVPNDELKPITPAYASPADRGCLTLAFWGTVVPHKGPHIILEALKRADIGRVNLLVIGQILPLEDIRIYVRQLREQAAEIRGLELRIYGTFKREELPFLLGDTDCVIVPSLVPEAGPQVPREALAHGIPVVVSRIGALPETITEGESGFSFEPGAANELAGILRRLVKEEGLLRRLRLGVQRSHIVTAAEHAAAIRGVYAQAKDDLMRPRGGREAEIAELGFLKEAILQVGFPSSG
jgi:glycosyltransferase involved in cell wall biosynthesis